MDDSKIIELFKERSEQAIIELSNKYGKLCESVAGAILPDPADVEECVNDAYLGVWNTIPPKEPEYLPGYVCKVVRNLAVKKLRFNSARKRNAFFDVSLDELEDCFPTAGSVEDEAEAKDAADAVNRFLSTLGKDDRTMFIRRYWNADTVEALARDYGKTKHNINARLSRIKKELKKYLSKEGIML